MNRRHQEFTSRIREEPPGVLLNGTLEVGAGVLLHFVRHQGATIELASDERCRISFSKPAQSRWLAWYAPFDVDGGSRHIGMPSRSLLAPLGASHFDRLEFPTGGAAFRQRSATPLLGLTLTGDITVLTGQDAVLASNLRRILSNAGMPWGQVELTVGFLLSTDPSEASRAA